MTAFLELRNVSKGFNSGGKQIDVLKNINLSVEEGEFIAIVGYTGSGKSTFINLISGLTLPEQGEILLKGKPITGPGSDRGVVFQNYSLLPWLSVFGNIELAVKQAFPKMKKAERSAHIKKYIEMVNLGTAKDKRPAQLSGGMRQRVAVARALAMEPEVLLLDEPLSALDALTRGSLQTEIERISSESNKTILLITNDLDEGMLLADRLIPLLPGPGATLGTVFELNYARPRIKAVLNSDMEYKTQRNSINNYLSELGKKRKISKSEIYKLPDIQPAPVRAILSFG